MFDKIAQQLLLGETRVYKSTSSKRSVFIKPHFRGTTPINKDQTSIYSDIWFDDPNDPQLIDLLDSFYTSNKRPVIIHRLKDDVFGYARSVNQISVNLDVNQTVIRKAMAGLIEEVCGYKFLSYVPNCPYFDPVPYAKVHTPVLYSNIRRDFKNVYTSFTKSTSGIGHGREECLPGFVYGVPVRNRSYTIEITPITYDELINLPASSWKPVSLNDVVLRRKSLSDYLERKELAFDASSYQTLEQAQTAWRELIESVI